MPSRGEKRGKAFEKISTVRLLIIINGLAGLAITIPAAILVGGHDKGPVALMHLCLVKMEQLHLFGIYYTEYNLGSDIFWVFSSSKLYRGGLG